MANLYVGVDERSVEWLERSIERLRRTGRYFHDLLPDADPVEHVMEALFPDAMPARYHVANVSLDSREEWLTLALRPVIESAEAWPFPPGFSLGFSGSWPRRAAQPVFRIREVFEIADAPTRSFEKEVDVFVYREDFQRRGALTDNILTSELAAQLPRISEITRERLRDWSDFIVWKRRLVHARARGLRYIGRGWRDDGNLVFQLFGDSAQSLTDAAKALRREDLHAYSLDASSEPWAFKPVENGPGKTRTYLLGRAADAAPQPNGTVKRSDDMPAGLLAEWVVSPSEEDLNELGTAQDGAAVRRGILARIPEAGFLSISMAGDLALLRRHEQAIRRLREQGGYSPYLSAYLFDVQQARQPHAVKALQRWHRPGLNPPQQEAVSKMLAAPDLCLLQGPPGTGKTTVIAEAILQMVQRGESVLLASQAHTAVDNALGRLGHSPAVRAIRLGRPEKVTDEGREFIGAASLARYYQSLAQHGEQQHLARWKWQDAELDRLADWIEQADYVLRDADAASRRQAQHDQVGNELQAACDAYRQQFEHAAQARDDASAARRTLEAMARLLADPGSCAEVSALPQELMVAIDGTVQDILALRDCGVRLSATAAEWRDLPHQRPHVLSLLVRDMQRIRPALAAMRRDAGRLSEAPAGLGQDPQTRLKIQRLDEEIRGLDAQIDQGAGEEVVAAWRSKRAERKQLQGQGAAAVDATACGALFDDATRWLATDTDPMVLARRLAAELDRISAASAVAESALQTLVRDVAQSLSAVAEPVVLDEGPWQRARAELERHRAESAELVERAQALQSRAVELARCCPLSDASPDQQATPVERVRLLARYCREGTSALQQRIDSDRALRDAWEPLLRDWVADLKAESSTRNDWEHLKTHWSSLCNVVAITCNERNDTLDAAGHAGFDVAVVDEVSKATPLELLLPLMRARRAILVGDHRQLPPLFQEGNDAVTFEDAAQEAADEQDVETALTPENLRRFEKMVTASLFKEHFEGAHDSIRSRLSVQFRMHPQIMKLVNHFYERQLSCGLTDPDRERAHGFTLTGLDGRCLLSPQDHVLWIDTSRDLRGNTSMEDSDPQGRPMRTNRMEAQLIAHLLCQLDQQALNQGYSTHKPLSVGVVSFYAGQLRKIREAIQAVQPGGRWQALDVDINTVIRYQGKEKEVILVSLVRNDGREGDAGRRRSSRANVARYEFINVALSRAKAVLIALGARSMFESYEVALPNMDRPGRTRRMVYRDMFRQMEAQGQIVDARHVMAQSQAQAARPPSGRSGARTGGAGARA